MRRVAAADVAQVCCGRKVFGPRFLIARIFFCHFLGLILIFLVKKTSVYQLIRSKEMASIEQFGDQQDRRQRDTSQETICALNRRAMSDASAMTCD